MRPGKQVGARVWYRDGDAWRPARVATGDPRRRGNPVLFLVPLRGNGDVEPTGALGWPARKASQVFTRKPRAGAR